MKSYINCIAFLCFASLAAFSQNFYSIDTIQKIEILFPFSNWDYILDTAKQGSDSYTLSSWVKINGVQFDSAGVKYKGNSSYNPNNNKNPFHIELDHFKKQDYKGIKDIKLSNGYNEPSFVREVMLYAMFQKYSIASRANFAQVYINGQYRGLYTNVEAVTNTFLADRFFTNNNTFVFADNGGCDLRYKGNDSTLYNTPYTYKSDYGRSDLMHLCDSLKNNIAGIENILDVDRALWYLAYCNALVILDSYLGNSKHNYYLYEDHNNRFNTIIWDLNGGLGIFNKPDNGAQLNVAQMQALTPMLHANDSMWPLVKNILAVSRYKKMYIAHMKTIMQENIANNTYYTYAQYLQTIIDTAVQSDPYKFGTYSQFISNLTNDVVLGPKTVPGISNLMNARNNFLNSTPEFQYQAPQITGVSASVSIPPVNSSFYITANVSNATAVFLGKRNSVLEKFNKVNMFDDGLHGDGNAGDGIYGASVTIVSPEMQYYIYADNNNAGMFSPQRAEHDYYIVKAGYSNILSGEVVLNELMALNNSTVQNANGNYSDWIELYNNSSKTFSLDYLNLSDTKNNLTKWQFPSGKSIAPGQFVIVWADDDTSSTELHCNFKLSSSGESVYLTYPDGYRVDSTVFSTQQADITWGRYPNGTGPFVSMPPTFSANNSLSSVNDWSNEINVKIFPNPANAGNFSVAALEKDNSVNAMEIKIINCTGEEVYTVIGKTGIVTEINSGLTPGIYCVQISLKNNTLNRRLVVVR